MKYVQNVQIVITANLGLGLSTFVVLTFTRNKPFFEDNCFFIYCHNFVLMVYLIMKESSITQASAIFCVNANSLKYTFCFEFWMVGTLVISLQFDDSFFPECSISYTFYIAEFILLTNWYLDDLAHSKQVNGSTLGWT